MRLITVSGPPSSGKTSVLKRTLAALRETGKRAGVVKFDCLSGLDRESYAAMGIPAALGISGPLCPDHFFASNIEDCLAWAETRKLDFLVTESAGLCNRCSPHIKGVLAVCVVDCLAGVDTPSKIGPMLKFADIVVITKGDVVSQAEREVFAFRTRAANGRADIIFVNGITGQGSDELARRLPLAPETESLGGSKLRFPMPAALCSYCLGETRIGEEYQTGNVRKMEFEPCG